MLKHYVRCTKCGWHGTRAALERIVPISPTAFLAGCPICKSTEVIATENKMNSDVEEVVAFKDSKGVIHSTEEGAINANKGIDFDKWYTGGRRITTGYGRNGAEYATSSTVLRWMLDNRNYLLELLGDK